MELKKVFTYMKNLPSWYGMLGRKKQIEFWLSKDEESGYNIKKNEYERLLQEIEKQYKEIRLHQLWSTRIGEYIVRYLTAVEDARKDAENSILDVFVLSDCMNHNSRLSRIMGRNIQIIDETNIDVWQYILFHFHNVKFYQYWKEYSIKNKERSRISEYAIQYFKLSEEEKKEGRQKMVAMGLSGPFVCVSSRDAKYLDTLVPEIDCSYHNYRDADINKFSLSADYLKDKGITVVRMGRYVQNKVNFSNCIDYASNYYDELLDIVLASECKFYVGDSSGIVWLPMVLNRPIALRNWVPAFLDSESLPYNPYNLLIFKKYYYKAENRFLSIKEMMQIEKTIGLNYDGHKYAELGIEVVENSAEETLDLIMEMNARIDGEWAESQEDIELQDKFQKIYREWCMQQNYIESATLHLRIGAMFLRKNPFLLDC